MWKKQGDLSDLGILQVLAMPISLSAWHLLQVVKEILQRKACSYYWL